MGKDVEHFLKPRGVVIVGASQEESKLGYGVARNLINSGYTGEIYLVNPRGGELFGYQVFQTLEDIPERVDLAVIVIPAKYVPQTLVACSHRGIKSVVIISGGFREVGPEGLAIEEECKKIAEEHGMRILGPNCIGIIDAHLPLDTTFVQPPMPEPGDIAFVTQSGALGAAIIDWAREQAFGFSQIISLGNQLDLSESDFLLPLAKSEETAVITMYMESIKDGAAFIENAAKASEHKPVLAVKVGRSEAGKKAASSHTGALAGSDSAYEAAFRRSGVLRANSVEEMFEWAKMLAWTPVLPENNRVAILTNAGGPGVTASDAVDLAGLQIANLNEATIEELDRILPGAASLSNPVDMLASASPAVYAQCLEALLKDMGVDMVVVIAPPPPVFKAVDIATELLPVIKRYRKPVAVSFMGSTLVHEAVALLREKKIPEYTFPERAVGAMAALWEYSQVRMDKRVIHEFKVSYEQKQKVNQILSGLSAKPGFIPPKAAELIMKAYDLPVVDLQFARTGDEAVEISSRMNLPVVMKLALEGVSHKSDVGGVILKLRTEKEIRTAFAELKSRVKTIGLEEKFKGVYLQPMVLGGQEVIIGAVRDPVFGPLMMFGSGGVEVEGLRDVQFSTAPLIRSELDYLLNATWAGKKLAGFRQLGPADVPAVRELLIRLGQLMVNHQEISEVEINPLIVMDAGQGVFAVDVRILL